jgi:hypothetical protein
MKKIITFVFGLLLFSLVHAQEAVHFTMGLLPNNRYDQTVSQNIKIELNLDSSSAEMLAKMEAGGMKNPTNQEQETNMETLIETGAMSKQTGKMPVVMSILKADEKLSKMLNPDTKFIGSAKMNELPVYDSISGITIDDSQKQIMLKTMSSLSQINLPNKSLKPGQYDTIHTPINIPLAGLTMKMDYVTIYLLKSIQGKTAFFDVSANFIMNMEVKDLPVDGSGSGSGSMEYDMDKHFPSLYKLKYQIFMRIAKEGLIMHMNMIIDLTSISKIQSS